MTPQRRRIVNVACALALLGLALAIFLPGLFTSTRSSSESSAAIQLKVLRDALVEFRHNDRDGNKIADYWVGDIAGLCFMKGPDGKPLHLIDEALAGADAAPLDPRTPASKFRYLFAVIPHRADGSPFDRGGHRNPDEFALCAYPDKETNQSSKFIFIVDQHGRVLRTPIKVGEGRRILRWPSDREIRENWQKVD